MKRLLIIILTAMNILYLSGCSKGAEVKNMEDNKNEIHNNAVEHGKIESNTTSLSKEDQEEIINVYEELQQALVDKNMDMLNNLLPSDYVAVHITGKRQTKEEWLNDIKNEDMRYFSFSDVSYSLSQQDDYIVLAVKQRIKARIYGSEGTWSIPGKRQFKKVEDKWKIIA